MKLIFVCTSNLNRSPTFEKWFKEHHPEHEVRSAGFDCGYPIEIEKYGGKDPNLEWADKIYIMDVEHQRAMKSRFKTRYDSKTVCLAIGDVYDTDSSELRNHIGWLWSTNKYLLE